MIEATVDKILPTPSGLRCGLRIEYSKNGPIRFVSMTIPWSAFGRDTRREILAAFNRLVDDIMDTEPLF